MCHRSTACGLGVTTLGHSSLCSPHDLHAVVSTGAAWPAAGLKICHGVKMATFLPPLKPRKLGGGELRLSDIEAVMQCSNDTIFTIKHLPSLFIASSRCAQESCPD